MVNPWSLLGLEVDADTRSIKRRYAQLLKQHRPDDDPEAFQRLREAYEYALQWASSGAENHPLPAPVAEPPEALPEAFGKGQRTFAPLSQTEQQGADEQAWVRGLPDSCASLDDALSQAREAGFEEELQLELLCRCQLSSDQAPEILHWAILRLDWLTPWQADYLPPVAMAQLAQRLLDAELAELREVLPEASEEALFERVRELARKKWMRPLELSRHLQQALIPILLNYRHGSPVLLTHLAVLFGWRERDGHLPCDSELWEQLRAHMSYSATWQAVQSQLAISAPQTPEQRACWFLLKPMGNGARRGMADRFDLSDWLACEHLAREIEERQPQIPMRLGVDYFIVWRQWKPLDWEGWAIFYAWLLAAVVLVCDQLYRSKAAAEPTLLKDASYALIGSILVMAILSVFRRGWAWFARNLSSLDVWASGFLLPTDVCRQGSGLLVIRHLLPAGIFAALVSSWAQHLPALWPAALGAATFVGSAYFLLQVTQGVPANLWLHRGLERLIRHREKLPVVGMFIGFSAFAALVFLIHY